MKLFRTTVFSGFAATVAVFTFAPSAVAIDRQVVVNGSSLSDPIGVGFGHWEGAEPLKIILSAEPCDIATAEMFAPEAVIWRATDSSKPDPWIFETAAIMPDEAFAVQFAGTLDCGAAGGKKGDGEVPPPPEWAVAVPDVDIDADGVPDETEFAAPTSAPNAPVGLGLVVGQSNPVTITLHPKRAGVLKLSSTTNGVVEVFEAAAWPAGQPLALPHEIAADATQTLSFVVRGKAEGETMLVARFVPGKKGGAGGDTDAVDKLTVKVAPLFVDLDVDSNNNGTIADNDDPIEDDASLPGKVILVNRLDYTGEGIPGYANGIDHLNHAGNGKSNSFTEMILRIPNTIDKKKATLTFAYSGAPPKSVTESPGTGGRHKVHDPGTANHVRVWTRDGHTSRLAADISATPAGHFVAPAVVHKASAVFGGVSGNEVTLWVEGVNESAESAARISVTLDADGTGKPELQAEDHVRLTSAWLRLVFTDVTSPTGIGDTAATDVPRIPKDVEADGIACDWQEDVNDGAMLVMRVVGSPILWRFMQEDQLAIKFGYIVNQAFEDLPVSGREGEYLTWPRRHPLVLDQPGALTGLGIEKPGEDFGTSHKVLDARFYRSPEEFDLDTPLNPALERKVNLAVRLNELKSILKYRGSKPHATAIVRAPLVLVHGVNSEPVFWTTGEAALGTRFHDDLGFRCRDFLVDHSGVDPQRPTELATLGFGEISSMYQRVRDRIGSSDAQHGAATTAFDWGTTFLASTVAPKSASGSRFRK